MIWALIDVSCLAHRALFSLTDVPNKDLPTGITDGIFSQIRTICEAPEVRSNKIALFFDSRTSLRKKVYPNYKKARVDKRSPEEQERFFVMKKQVDVLREDVFPRVGLPCYHQEGLESDDLIASAAQPLTLDWRGGPKLAVIVTNDGDLYQCISNGVHWWDPQRKWYHSPQSFKAQKGIFPYRWGTVKTLAGCHTDNVRGIKGVGEATAIKFLKDELAPNRKTYQRITGYEGGKVQRRNRNLVVLPHLATKPVVLREPKYNIWKFHAVCDEYGIFQGDDDLAIWSSFFNPHHFETRRRGEVRRGEVRGK